MHAAWLSERPMESNIKLRVVILRSPSFTSSFQLRWHTLHTLSASNRLMSIQCWLLWSYFTMELKLKKRFFTAFKLKRACSCWGFFFCTNLTLFMWDTVWCKIPNSAAKSFFLSFLSYWHILVLFKGKGQDKKHQSSFVFLNKVAVQRASWNLQ